MRSMFVAIAATATFCLGTGFALSQEADFVPPSFSSPGGAVFIPVMEGCGPGFARNRFGRCQPRAYRYGRGSYAYERFRRRHFY